ncbi:MAG: glycosyltransferase family 39 protein, partial [Patescibacteria group bacterium]
MPEQKTKGLLAIALWMAFVFIFAYSWVPGGLDFDSLNYAVAAKEIVRTNRWLAFFDPVYEGPFYYHFPLCIWVTAIFFKWLGVSSFTAKLFSMITAVSAAATIFFFGKLLKNVWVGFFAVISFLITNHIIRLSQECRMDLPVTFFITLALFFFILAQRRNRLYYLLFGLSTCLAIFAKDIFGVFPLAIVFLYLVITLQFKKLIHPLFILGVLLAVLPVIGWIRLERLLYNQTIFYGWWNWNFLHLLKAKTFITVKYYY